MLLNQSEIVIELWTSEKVEQPVMRSTPERVFGQGAGSIQPAPLRRDMHGAEHLTPW